jgi:hypothetical protein
VDRSDGRGHQMQAALAVHGGTGLEQGGCRVGDAPANAVRPQPPQLPADGLAPSYYPKQTRHLEVRSLFDPCFVWLIEIRRCPDTCGSAPEMGRVPRDRQIPLGVRLHFSETLLDSAHRLVRSGLKCLGLACRVKSVLFHPTGGSFAIHTVDPGSPSRGVRNNRH